jgi:hypothetical protein
MTINWQRIKNREIAPPAVPNLQGYGDRANFDVISNPPPKFNMFSEENPEPGQVTTRASGGALRPSWSRRSPATVPDLSVFDDWETTIYV